MGINYKITAKVRPGKQAHEGLQYGVVCAGTQTIGISKLADLISSRSSFSRADTIGLLEALTGVMMETLMEGNTVQLDSFGKFYLSLSSELKDSPQEVTQKCIKEARINFRMGKWTKEQLKNCRYEKMKR